MSHTLTSHRESLYIGSFTLLVLYWKIHHLSTGEDTRSDEEYVYPHVKCWYEVVLLHGSELELELELS